MTHPRFAQRYRMNVGTIVEADDAESAARALARQGERPDRRDRARRARARRRSRNISSETLAVGDTFVFAGEILRYEAMVEDEVYVSRATDDDPKVPSYEGGKFPLSTYLAARVRKILADPAAWKPLPEPVREWLEIQQWRSLLAGAAGAAGRNLSARRQILSRLLSVRGPARAPDARHAADAAAGARAAAAARLCRQRICAGGLGPRRYRPCDQPRATLARGTVRPRTCWATISKPGSPKAR